MLSDFLYCVVIPHRNVPELLRKCLESVPRLPYVHVLVVDNSDADKKASLALQGFTRGFGGLTVIEREPRNIGYIRNEALRYLLEHHFAGKLVFADADDYYTSNAAECFERFKDADNDLVWFGVEGRDEQGKATNNADFIKRNLKVYFDENDDAALRFNCGPLWGKFIDFGLIERNDIWFQEIESCEDTLFSAKLGFFAEKPYVDSVPLYVYLQREGSLVMSMGTGKAKMGFLAAYDTTCWLKEKGSTNGYYWTQYNVIWHWMNWCHFDNKAWKCFPRVFGLCNKKSALEGAIKVIKRKAKAKLEKN